MIDISLVIVFGITLLSIFGFYYYKLYSSEKHKSAIQLLIALNVIFTVYVLYKSILIHSEDIINTDSVFFDTLVSGLWGEIQLLFSRHPKMYYFYDELYNGVEMSNYHDRDEHLEQIICFKILGKITQYAEYYLTHIELPAYSDEVKQHNVKIIKILNNNMNSEVFRHYLDQYLNDFGGISVIKWFKEFYNIYPSNMKNTNKAEYINTHPHSYN